MRTKLWRLATRSKLSLALTVGAGFILLAGLGGGVYAALGGASGQADTATAVNLGKGLVTDWKLNGDPNDSTPFKNTGLLQNSPVASTDRKGQASRAYTFNGTNQYMTSTNSFTNPKVYSHSVWFKTNTTSGGLLIGLGSTATGQSGGYGRHIYMLNDGRLRFAEYNGLGSGTAANFFPITTTQSLNDNNWHNATAVQNDLNIAFYVDGQLVGTNTLSPALQTVTGFWRIGYNNLNSWPDRPTSLFFQGSIDDVRIYNRPLNAAEATALHASYDSAAQVNTGAKGLVGHWKMDDNANDSSPFRSHGIVNGAALAADRKGRASSAYVLSGSNSYLSVADNPAHRLNGTFSLSFWYKDNASSNSFPGILSKGGGSSSGSGWNLFYTPSDGRLCFKRDNLQPCSPPGTVTTSWRHFVISHDGTNLRYYVDGINVVTSAITYATNTNTAQLRMGVGDQYVKGALDDVRIYNRALSLAEVNQQYDSYNATLGLNSLSKGLVGDWAFNGNANDGTPYRNHGVVTGAALVADRKGRGSSTYTFNGTTNQIQVPHNSSLKPTATMTASVWVNPSNIASSAGQKFLSITESGGYSLTANGSAVDLCAANMLMFAIRIGGGYVTACTDKSILTNGNWYHLTGTYDGSTVKLYVNGTQVASTATSGAIIYSTNNPLCIGAEPNGTNCTAGNYYAGTIDDARIYNRALSLSEIQALYAIYR